MALRRLVGVSALLLATLAVPISVARVLAALGIRVDYPAWLGVSTASVVLGVVLVVLVRFGSWRLSPRSGGSAAMPAALVCTLVSIALHVALLLSPTVLSTQPPIASGQSWLSMVASLLFAWGLVRSGLAAPWVGWLGIVAEVFPLSFSFTERWKWLEAFPVHTAASVLQLVFLASLGFFLLRPVPGASNKGINLTTGR